MTVANCGWDSDLAECLSAADFTKEVIKMYSPLAGSGAIHNAAKGIELLRACPVPLKRGCLICPGLTRSGYSRKKAAAGFCKDAAF